MSEQIIDTSGWPLVHYVMPESVPDSLAEHHIAALQAVLDRQQPFVLIFSGVELPKNSALFFRLYKAWGSRTREAQQRYCRGAVRVEPDEAKRRSFWRQALRYLTTRTIPYPYKVVASHAEAEQQAQCWLQDTF
ncbi:hypothetical protein N5923_19365 [Erwiniaceae bacterium BAC15a-03b]|uniref:Uncharacterized protein n=1 Tax=Winslowiella arboricola TaxID=2978220 RepID=A0A9J6PQD5_9GAMM|nr:hypothetical protein [Winslowiella arboricola]MCU5775500.1 hypothetical protein [Winslowiella arboricola]MCU5779650.1 hypothetical protein [Winslowiella arboricola]